MYPPPHPPTSHSGPPPLARQSGADTMPVLLSIALTVALVPVLVALRVPFDAAAPIALLCGIAFTHLIRLAFYPKSVDLFIPSTLVAVYFLTYFALRAFYLETVPFFNRSGRNSYDDYIVIALWCSCAGFLCFLLGAHSPMSALLLRRLPRFRITWPASIPSSRILFLLLAGLGARLYLFKLGVAVGNLANPDFQLHPPPGWAILMLQAMDLAWILTLMFLWLPGRESNRKSAWLLLPLCLVTIAMRLGMSGGKVDLIQPILEAAIVFNYAKRRLRLWEMIAVGVPVLMIAFGVINFYRFVVVGPYGTPKSLGEVMSRVASTSELLKAQHGSDSRGSALNQMTERDTGIDALALVMKYTPRPFPYAHGLGWLEAPLSFIPRQIWKNKPLNLPSAEFEHTYMSEPVNFTGFSSMHVIADFYRNFSFPGVLVGMFLLGVALKAVYAFCAPARTNAPGLLIYAMTFPVLVHSFEMDLGSALIGIVRSFLIVGAAAYFLGVRVYRPRPSRVAFPPPATKSPFEFPGASPVRQ